MKRSTLALLLLTLAGCSSASPLHTGATTAPAPETARAIELPDLSRYDWLLQKDAELALAEGAGPLTVLAADVGAEGDRVGAFVELPGGACAVVFARGSDGVDDLDMLAFADEGTPIGADEATDPHPALLLCSPQPQRAYVVARIAAGRGLVALGLQPVANGAAERVKKALNAKGTLADGSKEGEVWPGLDAKVQAFRREAGGRWEELRRVALPIDARAVARLSASIDAGRCMAVLVSPSNDSSEVDVQILDGDGRIIGRGFDAARDRQAVICSSLSTLLTLELRARVASGVAAAVLARSVAGTEAEISSRIERIEVFPALSLVDERARLGERLRAAGYPAPSTQLTGTAQPGKRSTLALTLPRGCNRIDAIGGVPLAGLSVDAWSDSGLLLGRSDGGASATVFTCGEGGKTRIDVEATSRPGPFAIEVRTEGKADAKLTDAGLAGGRLLSRINSAGQVVRAEQLTSVQRVALDAASLRTIEFNIPERRCLEVAATVGTQGHGIDLRLVDALSQDELGLTKAAHSAALTACANASGARTVIAELRLASGKADAVVGAHVLETAP